ncbi:MAG: FtsW/RodA/SpoVE family cell cycle protein [Thermoanaerobaculaceae bacterium]
MPKRKHLDRWLLFATLVTAMVGIALVWSASAPLARDYYRLPSWEFAYRQLLAWLLGTVGMLVLAFLPLELVLHRMAALTSLAVTWVLLAIPYFQPEVAQTHRWLRLPIGSLQPSTLAKVTLPLVLAVLLAEIGADRARDKKILVAAGLLTVGTVALIFFEPDLGMAMLLLGTAWCMLVFAGAPLAIVIGGAVFGGVIAVVGVLLEPYRLTRLAGFLSGGSYQVQQALIALGSGGLLGRGLGASVQKLFFLPQPHTDFIFAIAGEEVGFVGAVLLLALLGLLVARCFRAGVHAPSRAAALLALGLGSELALQAWLNLAVCLGLFPPKGLPLPLISAGGSDLLANLLALGLVLNVAKEGS